MLKNHGYCKAEADGVLRSYVAANEGVFECIPPESEEGTWEIKQILDEASSDMAFADFDNDGELDMKKMLNSFMESGVERSQELRVF